MIPSFRKLLTPGWGWKAGRGEWYRTELDLPKSDPQNAALISSSAFFSENGTGIFGELGKVSSECLAPWLVFLFI